MQAEVLITCSGVDGKTVDWELDLTALKQLTDTKQHHLRFSFEWSIVMVKYFSVSLFSCLGHKKKHHVSNWIFRIKTFHQRCKIKGDICGKKASGNASGNKNYQLIYFANRKLQFLVSGSYKQLSNKQQSHCKDIIWLSINKIGSTYEILRSEKLNNC